MIFQLYAKWVVKNPKFSLAIAFIFALVFAICGRDVRLSNHFADLYAIDNDDNAYRGFYRQQFGADDGLLMAVLQPEKVDELFFEKLELITAKLEESEHYIRILSPTNSSVIWSSGDDVHVDPLFGEYDDHELQFSEKINLLKQSTLLADHLVSSHSDTFALIAEMPAAYDRFIRIEQPAKYFRKIVDDAFNNSPYQVEIHYAGIAYARIGILDLMMQDLIMLVPLTTLVIAIFSYWIFRKFVVVWSTLLTTSFGLACTIGIIGLNNDDINQMTIAFPVLLMVIVVANDVHFFHRYFSEIKRGKNPQQAVFIMAEKISKAAFLSCITTMIGFYALLTAEMTILRSFGFYLGTGVLLSYIGMILIIPPCLLLIAPDAPESGGVSRFNNRDRVSWLVEKVVVEPTRTTVLVSGLILLLIAAYFSTKAEYDYFLSDMLDENHPQVLAGKLVDRELSGSLPIEISLLGQEDDFKRAEILQRVDQLEIWLESNGVGKNNQSLPAVIKSLNQAISGENRVPDNDEAVAQLLLLIEGSPDNILSQLVSDNYAHARIKSNSYDLGARGLVELKAAFHHYADELMQGTGIKVRMTGELPVAYEGMNRLTEELINSVITAMFFIVITIFIVFRDIRLAIGSIFPNMLPIILGLAFYAFSDKGMNPLPGIAFCIAIGIAVDDTVHLFSRFNEELEKGTPRQQAVIDAVNSVKGALYISSIILTVGFIVFLLSGFSWNRDLGVLGAYLIVVALISDLVFTPAVLSFGRRHQKDDTPIDV